MKKCPYCAEEIQDKALICRYCHKKVGGIFFRRTVRYIILAAIIVFLLVHGTAMKDHFEGFRVRVQEIVKQVGEFLTSIQENMKRISSSMTAVRDTPLTGGSSTGSGGSDFKEEEEEGDLRSRIRKRIGREEESKQSTEELVETLERQLQGGN